MSPCAFLVSASFLLALAQPEAATKTKVDRDHAVKIALAHLNIDKVTKEPSAAFNLRVREGKLTQDDIKELDGQRHGFTRHKDGGGLPDSFEVFHITLQHGLSGDSSVFVTKNGGRVVLVKFMPEG
jgi:hypothetical protein